MSQGANKVETRSAQLFPNFRWRSVATIPPKTPPADFQTIAAPQGLPGTQPNSLNPNSPARFISDFVVSGGETALPTTTAIDASSRPIDQKAVHPHPNLSVHHVPPRHASTIPFVQISPSQQTRNSNLSTALQGVYIGAPNMLAPRMPVDSSSSPCASREGDDGSFPLGFVSGHITPYTAAPPWNAPAMDNNVSAVSPVSASYMHAPLRAVPPYTPLGHTGGFTNPHPNHMPVMHDPWAQSAVWRPSAVHPVLRSPFNGSPELSPFAPTFPKPSAVILMSSSSSATHPNEQPSNAGESRRPPKRNGKSRDSTTNKSQAPISHPGHSDNDLISQNYLKRVESPAPTMSPKAHVPPGGASGWRNYDKHVRNVGSSNSSARGYQSSNGQASVREYNRRISACARRRDLSGAFSALSELDRTPKVSRNLFTYNAVINALVMCSQYAKAEGFWQEMQDAGIEPNLVTFNTMLKSCFGGTDEDVSRAFVLLKEMEDRGISADRVTLNSLINACVSAGRIQDAQDVYQRMRQLSIEPDAYTFCTLAKQARHKCDVSMLDALLLHQLHHHTLLQQRTDSSSIPSGESSDLTWGVSPVAYNTIADAYIRCGYPSRAISLLERMRSYKKSCTSTSPRGGIDDDTIPVSPDIQTYNVRLKALREARASTNEAFAVLSEMEASGYEADHITLLTLADLCCRREDMELAEGVLRSATENDIAALENGSLELKTANGNNNAARHRTRARDGGRKPTSQRGHDTRAMSQSQGVRRNANQPRNAKANAALFNALIRGYSSLDPPNVDAAVNLYLKMRSFARVGDAKRAEVIISEMEAAGRSNVVTYNAYLKAHRGSGFSTALSILERIKRAGLRPDVVTYNTIIDCLSSEENGTQIAEELVRKDMPLHGVRPDLLTFNTLIKGVARNKSNKNDTGTGLGAAYKWFRELQSRGLKPDEFTYQSMVSACAAAGDAPKALEFFRKVEVERCKRVKEDGQMSKNSMGATVNLSNSHSPNDWTMVAKAANASSGKHQTSQQPSMTDEERLHVQNVSERSSNPGSHTRSRDWMPLPHPAAYIALMRAFLSSNSKSGVDSVLLLRDEMLARGLELGRTGYTAVADAYAERADIDSVDATLRQMRQTEVELRNQPISPVHQCIRMKALCNAGRLDDAIAILPEVENADAAVFNILIFACTKNNDMERLMMVLRAMESSQIEPDMITSRALRTVMKSLAQTLTSFDKRFRAGIALLANSDSASPHPSSNGEEGEAVQKYVASAVE